MSEAADGEDPATDRVSVTAYVPRYQREIWDDHADELGLSRSEYVATMVQAGRSDVFGAEATPPDGNRPESGDGGRPDRQGEDDEAGADPDAGDRPDRDADPWGRAFEDRVLDALDEPRDWESLLDDVTADVADRLERTLATLQRENRVRYSGRRGGYVRVDRDGGGDGA